MLSKKAQGLSLNVVIIAAIALVVLVVLVTLFTGQMGGWVKNTDSCTSAGGLCVDSVQECQQKSPYAAVFEGKGCKDTSDVCCKVIA